MGSNTELYKRHLDRLDGWLDDALTRARTAGVDIDAVLFHAGRAQTYYADDEEVTFWATPHFRRWAPVAGREHVVLARPGRRPTVVRVRSRDYWHDTSPPPVSYWEEAVDFHEVEGFDQVGAVLGPLGRTAYVGSAAPAAAELGIPDDLVDPPALLAPLDWHRAVKTEHELALIRVACERAAAGHAAARDEFGRGGSEREILWAYLKGSDQVGPEVPFGIIVALDEKGAILHYQHKRGGGQTAGRSVIVDGGASHEGYVSDVTRTWTKAAADPVFRTLVEGVDGLEQELVAMVAPGVAYQELHIAAHRKLAELLAEVGVVVGGAEAALEAGFLRAFMPHGVGHHMGIQVHDVGGRQAGPDGGTADPPEESPFLRTTRRLEPGHVVTIEPGLYFVEMLLDPLRSGPDAGLVDWALVDRLAPHGGIRIEDDVVCTEDGFEDLTRSLIAGPRGC